MVFITIVYDTNISALVSHKAKLGFKATIYILAPADSALKNYIFSQIVTHVKRRRLNRLIYQSLQ